MAQQNPDDTTPQQASPMSITGLSEIGRSARAKLSEIGRSARAKLSEIGRSARAKSPTIGQSARGRSAKSRKFARWLTALLVIILLALIACSLHTLYCHKRPTANACADPFAKIDGKQQARLGPQGAEIAPAAEQKKYGRGVTTLKLQVGQQLKLPFERAVNTRSLPVVYFDRAAARLPHPEVYLYTRVDAFRRSDDGAPLDAAFIRAYAKSDGQVVGLTVCVDRAGGYIGGPGTYTGSVTIDDNRTIAPVTVPITITMQFQYPWIVLWLLLLTAIPGTWVLWVLRTARSSEESAFAWGDMLRWLRKVGGLAAVGAGAVAALAVYSATYLKDPTWGTSVLQVLALYGGMFSAFITSAGITQLGSPSKLPSGGTK